MEAQAPSGPASCKGLRTLCNFLHSASPIDPFLHRGNASNGWPRFASVAQDQDSRGQLADRPAPTPTPVAPATRSRSARMHPSAVSHLPCHRRASCRSGALNNLLAEGFQGLTAAGDNSLQAFWRLPCVACANKSQPSAAPDNLTIQNRTGLSRRKYFNGGLSAMLSFDRPSMRLFLNQQQDRAWVDLVDFAGEQVLFAARLKIGLTFHPPIGVSTTKPLLSR